MGHSALVTETGLNSTGWSEFALDARQKTQHGPLADKWKFALALMKEIGGELHVQPGGNGRGTRVTITFSSDIPGVIPSG